MFLNDVKDYNLLDLMEKKIEDDYLNIPINIVNKISRSKIMSNKKSGKKSDEVNEYVKRNPKAKEYPVIIQATAYIIEQIELGERVTNASVRQVINCDYKVAKLAMDIIDDLYIPKNTRMKSFF